MAWLKRLLPHADARRVLVCPGIHSVLAPLISLLARPGDLVCVEALACPGLKAMATQRGVQLHALPLGDEGPSAEAFEQACKTLKPRALIFNPTLHNPTTLTTSGAGRAGREALADVALRRGIPLVAQRLAGALRATTVMASPITNALATQWVNDGTAEAVLQAIRNEPMAHQALATRQLARHALQAQPEGFHFRPPLAFKLERGGICELPAHICELPAQPGCGRGGQRGLRHRRRPDPPHAVRVCLGGATSRDGCDSALRLFADTLDDPGHPHATVM